MPPRSKRASRALMHITEADPALASLSIWCRMVDGDVATHTAGETITIGPDFSALPLHEQIGAIGHHILHVALRHGSRMKNMRTRMGSRFSEKTYNLASDAIVNEVIEQAGHALPRPAVTLSTVLKDVLVTQPDQALSTWDTDRLYAALYDQDEEGQQKQREYEERNDFQQDLHPSHDSGDDQYAEDWQGHLTRATGSSGAINRGIAHILKRIADIPQPTIPWELHLRRLLAKATSEVPRVSYRRPRNAWVAADSSARMSNGPTPIFEPGFSRDRIRLRIVVGLDSSGSISERMIRLFAAEISGIARRTQAETHVMYFDETVYKHEVLANGSWDPSVVDVLRDGGTSFVDVIEQASTLAPSALVVLTDMNGPFGPKPSFPVIWASPEAFPPPPPFGTVLSLAR